MAKIATDTLVLTSFANPRRLDVVATFGDKSMTRQEFSDECDINQIMARYERNGIWPVQIGLVEPRYVDFTAMPDTLAGTLSFLEDAKASFMLLPASVRKEFDNDAVRFVEYAADPDNIGQMREWGLAEPEKVAAGPLEVRVVSEPNAPPIAPTAPVKA